MTNKNNGRSRLDVLRFKAKWGKRQKKSHKKPSAKGSRTLPNHIDDKERLRQIISNQRECYKDILGDSDIPTDVLIDQNPRNIPSLLEMADVITAKNVGFVIVGDIKNTLPKFSNNFSKAPFYVLSANAPDVSFAFSELVNQINSDSATRRKEVMASLWTGGQNKANDFNTQLQEHIKSIQKKGIKKTKDIICQLNEQGFRTRRGEDWTVANFYRAEKQIEKLQASDKLKGPS